MVVIAIDPGYRESARVVYDGRAILQHAFEDNDRMLAWLDSAKQSDAVLVVEEMQLFTSSYGIGKEVMDSIWWGGRFAQIWQPQRAERLLRATVRGHLQCSKGGDASVRNALIQRFGPFKEEAIGTKKAPGPLYGLKSHEFSALALAVAWWDRQEQASVVREFSQIRKPETADV